MAALPPEKSPRNPTLNEALQRVVSEALRPWAPGTLLRRRPNFTVYLRSEPTDQIRARDIDWDEAQDGRHIRFSVRKTIRTRPHPILWTILDNRWDDRECVVWIEVIAVGEPNRRGWVRALESDWNWRESAPVL